MKHPQATGGKEENRTSFLCENRNGHHNMELSSFVVFVLRKYILKVHVLVSSEHKLCQI
jgi:hypothetical protein